MVTARKLIENFSLKLQKNLSGFISFGFPLKYLQLNKICISEKCYLWIFPAVSFGFGVVFPVLSCCTAVFLWIYLPTNAMFWIPAVRHRCGYKLLASFIASGPLVIKINMTEEACLLVGSAKCTKLHKFTTANSPTLLPNSCTVSLKCYWSATWHFLFRESRGSMTHSLSSPRYCCPECV